jgi:hypothetical protein
LAIFPDNSKNTKKIYQNYLSNCENIKESKMDLNKSNSNHSNYVSNSNNSISNLNNSQISKKIVQNSVKTVSVNLEHLEETHPKPIKKITPMHLKLYESSMQDV